MNMSNAKVLSTKFTYRLLLFGLIWVVILYDIIQYYCSFPYIDELFSAFIGVLALFKHRRSYYIREYLICGGVFLFFLFYSLFYGTNVKEAVWTDFLLQFKPYVVFYSVCLLNFRLDSYYKKKLNKWCLRLGLLMIPFGFMTQYGVITSDAGGPRFTSMVSIIGLLYLYSSPCTKKDILITFAIWTIAFIPMKSKFFGFYALALFLFYGIGEKRIKLNLKYLCFGIVALVLVYFAAYEKFSFYFLEGSQSDTMFARPALFYGALEILKDYFPFGSGFGSYASFASAEYFSNLYWKMDVTRFSELSEGYFLCDTFFPSLAQFGIVGIFFFVLFWKCRIHEFNECYSIDNVHIYKCLYLIFGYFMIESMADSSYVQNRGLFMFLIMAMFINELKTKQDIIIKNKVC